MCPVGGHCLAGGGTADWAGAFSCPPVSLGHGLCLPQQTGSSLGSGLSPSSDLSDTLRSEAQNAPSPSAQPMAGISKAAPPLPSSHPSTTEPGRLTLHLVLALLTPPFQLLPVIIQPLQTHDAILKTASAGTQSLSYSLGGPRYCPSSTSHSTSRATSPGTKSTLAHVLLPGFVCGPSQGYFPLSAYPCPSSQPASGPD